MKRLYVYPAILILVAVILNPAHGQTTRTLAIIPEQVQRVEILYVPERILVRASLTPEKLEQLYDYKLEIRNARESAEWKELLPLLQRTAISPSERTYDHRTAVLLLDKGGKRIASIYFDQFGKGGTIDGHSGSITPGIYEWAKALLKGVD